jgi:hypothetical protein
MSLILSIDGGGALGVGPAYFMALLESSQDIKEDVLAGTSVGGLLCLLRASGRSWQQIHDIADSVVPRIFSRRQWGIVGPKWDSGPLESVCREYLSIPAREAKTPFFVPCFDMATGQPKIWDNTDDVLMCDIALATSAAPSYFPPRGSYVDGGLVANNPSMIGLMGAVHAGLVNLADVQMLSLATGGSFWENPHVHEEMIITSWLSPIIKACLSGGQKRDAFMCAELLGDRYKRVSPADKEDFPMDDLARLDEWRALWLDAYKDASLGFHKI